MIETLVVALLVWLWVIERRINGIHANLRSLRLDLDEVRRASRTATPSGAAAPAALVETPPAAAADSPAPQAAS